MQLGEELRCAYRHERLSTISGRVLITFTDGMVLPCTVILPSFSRPLPAAPSPPFGISCTGTASPKTLTPSTSPAKREALEDDGDAARQRGWDDARTAGW